MSESDSKNKRKVVRINLEVPPQVREHIKDLQKRSDAGSLAEVFRRALALYDMVLTNQAEGGKMVLESAKGEREVIRVL